VYNYRNESGRTKYLRSLRAATLISVPFEVQEVLLNDPRISVIVKIAKSFKEHRQVASQ